MPRGVSITVVTKGTVSQIRIECKYDINDFASTNYDVSAFASGSAGTVAEVSAVAAQGDLVQFKSFQMLLF